jgi:HD superfamily phosphohydrolase YqeK
MIQLKDCLTKDQLDDLKGWFLYYISAFRSSDEYDQRNYLLKKRHSFRVARLMRIIGQEMDMTEEGLRLAEIIGLFHDLGRFDQYARYRTFADTRSVNHAALGIRILEENRVLTGLDRPVRNTIIKAVAYHNRLRIPPGEQGLYLFFCRLVRDADKLDIYRIVADYYQNEDAQRSAAIELDLSDTAGCSRDIIRCLEEGRLIRGNQLKSLNDFKLLQMGWVFDIHFLPALQIVQDKEYLKAIRQALPDSREVDSIYSQIMVYITERMAHGQQTTHSAPYGSTKEAPCFL